MTGLHASTGGTNPDQIAAASIVKRQNILCECHFIIYSFLIHVTHMRNLRSKATPMIYMYSEIRDMQKSTLLVGFSEFCRF